MIGPQIPPGRLGYDDHVVPKGSLNGWQFPMWVCPPGPDHGGVWTCNDIRACCPIHGADRLQMVVPA